jgi:hypothetical protein
VVEAETPTTETFRIDPGNFTTPKRSLTLGLDVAPGAKSTIKPLITSVHDGQSQRELGTIRSVYGEHVGTEKAGQLATAVLVNLSLGGKKAATGTEFQVKLGGENGTTGEYLLGYFLPGDVDGDGVVESSDVKLIRTTLNATIGSNGYNFNADSNRDGKITAVDLSIAQRNLGVKTTLQPVLMANLDPASDSGVPNRITVYEEVIFHGTGTPGATVTYSEVKGKVPAQATTIAADGTYKLMVKLAQGENTFRVTAADRFGQTIAGEIEPVTYEPAAVPVESPKTPVDPPKPIVEVAQPKPTPRAVPRRLAEGSTAVDPNSVVTPQDQAARLREMLASRRQG